MKNPLYLSILAFLILMSCSENEDEKKTNYINFNKSLYYFDVDLAEFINYGCDDSHCNYDFRFYTNNRVSYVYLELYDKGGESFVGGTFKLGSNNSATPDYNFFEDDRLVIGGILRYPVSGKVVAKMLNEENEWKIDFSYSYEDGTKASGNFTGLVSETTGEFSVRKE